MKALTIKRTLALIGLATVATAVLPMAAAIVIAGWRSGRAELLDKVNAEARLVANLCAAPLASENRTAAENALRSLHDDASIREAAVFDRAGRPFALYRRDADSVGSALAAAGGTSGIDSRGARVVVPVEAEDEPLGSVALLADTSRVTALLWHLALLLVGVAVVSAVAALLLLVRLQKTITDPMRRLVELTRGIAETNDYHRRADFEGPSEIGVFASGLNEMLLKLEQHARETEERRQSLEQEVARRTWELAQTNERLEEELAERRRTAAALREAALQWRTTFDAIHDAVCMVDEQGLVMRCNRALVDRLERDVPITGQPLSEVLRRAYGADLPTSIEATAGLDRRHEQTRFLGGRWFEVTFDPMRSAAGEFTGGVLILHDVTEQRSLQEQLVQAQKMEAVGRLAGGVAHDFNNILASILAFSGFLIEEQAPGSSGRADAEEIQRAAQRAADLTRKLLAFSRKQVINASTLDVGQHITDLAQMIRRLIGESIDTRIELQPDLGCTFMDATQFEQVLMNLCVNARDAMPGGGRLTIRARNHVIGPADEGEPRELAAGDYVEVAVEDTGSGIAPEALRRIYEPFFTTKPKGHGTGLGLSMVYGTVKQCGGAIDVTTAVGEGTCFRVYLPRVERGAALSGATVEARAPRGNGERVLLVEDDAQVRRALRKLLEASGYQVLEASDGEEGLARAEREPVEVVVSDVVMPRLDGFSMGRVLRDRNPRLPIIFMSGYFETAARDAVVPDALVLIKPFSDAALTRRIREALDGRARA